MTLDPVPTRLDAYLDEQAREPGPYEQYPTKENEMAEKLKFQTNVPQTVIFPFGDWRESTGQYGTDYLYSVTVAGQRVPLYATAALHDRLQQVGTPKGVTLQISKIEVDETRKGWRIADAQGNELYSDATPPQPTPAEAPPPPKPNGNPVDPTPVHAATNANPNLTLDDLAALMGGCMERALTLWTALEPDADLPWTPENIQATANTLFIEANRRGITVFSTPRASLPSSTSPTPTPPAAGARQRLQQRTTATADEPPWAGDPAPIPEESPF